MRSIDNSEWMRNSDFSPSRFESQQDAVNLICGTKTKQNIENVVGLITTGGRQVEVQVSLTSDLAKILGALHRVQVAGETNLLVAIQVARLALRHRQNKRQEQRIVLFVGSPVNIDSKELVRLGGQLKKNKIAVDIISFGEENTEANEEVLQAFHKSVNNHDNSTMVTIPPGTSMLSEVLCRTPIIRGTDAGAAPGGGAGGDAGGFDWANLGVDPDVDPELAMALRMSLESAEQERKKTETETTPASTSEAAPAPSGGGVPMDEDPELAAALRMSMAGFGADEDEELQRALQLSLQSAASDNERTGGEGGVEKMDEEKKEEGAEVKKEGEGEVDADYMKEVLLGLPGVDANDPEMQAILASLQGEEKPKDEEKKEEGK